MSEDFTPLQIEFFRGFLLENSGYNLVEGKEYLLRSRLKTVLDIHPLETYDDIINALKRDPHGTIAVDVIEAMTVNETFFFRDDKPFEFFEKQIIPELIKISEIRPIKIWSAACSTGQEPYSIAILLEEYKRRYPSLDYLIDASDINNRILTKARHGTYSNLEVGRGLLETQRNRYFQQIDEGWKINDAIKEHVTFFQQNLRENFSSHKGPYDVVFLRNVLIYFDQGLKNSILQKTVKLMHPDAHLILGVAENIYCDELPITRCQNMTGIYQKQ